MGYRTPDIDRIAAEGAMFTDDDGERSCTAGRVVRVVYAVAALAGAVVLLLALRRPAVSFGWAMALGGRRFTIRVAAAAGDRNLLVPGR